MARGVIRGRLHGHRCTLHATSSPVRPRPLHACVTEATARKATAQPGIARTWMSALLESTRVRYEAQSLRASDIPL
eukprot:3893100-Rhodomonas_salina.3